MSVVVHHGDSREVIRTFDNESIDSCVCDPPYALVSIGKRFGADDAAPAKVGKSGAYARASAGFMGQKWDTGEVSFDPEFWRDVLRVLKPGAHLLAFGGTRTYHRLAVAIEDAGFEIRDAIQWLYGSGFPKSHNVGKGIDKAAGAARETVGTKEVTRSWKRDRNGTGDGAFADRGGDASSFATTLPITAPATDAARQWEGWGTALKPACEIICVARKPLIGTVAANVLQHGTGALNIDACRVGGFVNTTPPGTDRYNRANFEQGYRPSAYGRDGEASADRRYTDNGSTNFAATPGPRGGDVRGRWPANVAHDGSDEVVSGFPETNTTGGYPAQGARFGYNGGERKQRGERLQMEANGGSASRFFYTAKADAADRLGSKHPTVKPVDLMRWLVRLVTPPAVFVCESCYNPGHENSTTPPGRVSPLRDVQSPVQTSGQSPETSLLFEAMRGHCDASTAETPVRDVRQGVQAGSGVEASALLLDDVQRTSEGREMGQGLRDDAAGIPPALQAGSSALDESRIHHGTSASGGADAGSPAKGKRGRTSPKRPKGGQSSGESSSNAQDGARQNIEAAAEADHVSPLRGQDQNIRTCPTCGGALTERRGTVLDPFAGSGTTGMACLAEGFNAVLIEREAAYVADIKRRIAHVSGQDAPLFAAPAAGTAP